MRVQGQCSGAVENVADILAVLGKRQVALAFHSQRARSGEGSQEIHVGLQIERTVVLYIEDVTIRRRAVSHDVDDGFAGGSAVQNDFASDQAGVVIEVALGHGHVAFQTGCCRIGALLSHRDRASVDADVAVHLTLDGERSVGIDDCRRSTERCSLGDYHVSVLPHGDFLGRIDTSAHIERAAFESQCAVDIGIAHR